MQKKINTCQTAHQLDRMKTFIAILLMIIWSTQISAYDEMELKIFKTMNKCPGCDLSGADLHWDSLEATDLRGANLAIKILSERFSISYISTNSPSPHITIDSGFDITDMRRFHSALDLMMANIQRFVLEGKGIGIFVERAPVIHIRWKVNEELNSLRSQIYEYLVDLQREGVFSGYRADLNWLPKTTLAFRVTTYDNLPLVLNSIRDINFSGSFRVDNLSTYGYSLNDGESRMGDIKFKV